MSNVEKPKHYNTGKIEVIDAIEDWKLNFHRGNVIKYVARAGHKDHTKEVEDLEKAHWYLSREIFTLRKRTADAIKENTDITKEQLANAWDKYIWMGPVSTVPNAAESKMFEKICKELGL